MLLHNQILKLFYPTTTDFCSQITTRYIYTFNGKEKDYESGYHYYGSRYYNSELSMWLSVDPMSDKYPSLTPYNYCANNPVKLIDPNGEEIWVAKQKDDTYIITDGIQNNDKGIYLINSDGSRSNNKIGETLTEYSFFKDNNEVAKDAILNPNDNSGKDFINNMSNASITIAEYMLEARNKHSYDFKHRGYNIKMSTDTYYNRGMKLDGAKGILGNNIYGSARDVGNYVAGMIAAQNGLSWETAKFGFNGYQSRSSIKKFEWTAEQMVTLTSERAGFNAFNGSSNKNLINPKQFIKHNSKVAVKKVQHFIERLKR